MARIAYTQDRTIPKDDASMGSLASDSDSDDDVDWTHQLQRNRLRIVNRVDYSRLAAALQSAFIFDHEDHEKIKNPYHNPTLTDKANAMINELLRKGKENYDKFLKVMGGYYPDLYTLITGLDPPEPIPPVKYVKTDDGSSEVLSFIFAKLTEKKAECTNLEQENRTLKQQIKDYLSEIEKSNEKLSDFESKKDRYKRIEDAMKSLKEEAEHMKNENYTVCMKLVHTNEENAKLREDNMKLRLENEKTVVDLRQLENKVRSERSQSFYLKKRLDAGPSERDITAMQKEIDDLKFKIAQSHGEKDSQDGDTRLQILKRDLDEAFEMYAESSEKLNKLREELSSTESSRTKFIEENERLQLQCKALTDDCGMYKARRDAVWQQLQEVEKERDQLLKERNEAQLTAQTYMDEKTKYWYKIRELEEFQDKISLELREKEKALKEANLAKSQLKLPLRDFELDVNIDTDRLSLPDCDGSQSSVSSGSCTLPGRIHRKSNTRRRVKQYRNSVRSEKALTDAIRSEIFYHLVKADGDVHKVHINGRNLSAMVEFAGGNETGIFFHRITKSSYADIIGLVSGMKLLKIGMDGGREVNLRNCTLENIINVLQEVGESVSISVQYKEEEYKSLLERMKERHSGDSFYVRANFSLRKEGYLSFEKGAVLHVVDTRPENTKESQWLAYLVDLYNGLDASKSGLIPSYRNCISNSQLLRSYPSLNRPLSVVDFTKLFRTMPGSQDFCSSPMVEDISTGSKCVPYTVVKLAPVHKVSHRPCFFLPRTLCKVLSYKLTTMAEPFQFDLPLPESRKCDEKEAYQRVLSGQAISCNKINDETHELVTIEAVKKMIEKGKHCILPYNDRCISVEKFISNFHAEQIYPIVFFLSAEKEKSIKSLLQPGQKDAAGVYQDIKADGLMLDKSVPQYVTVNLDRCSRLEDAVQNVMDLVADGSINMIWVSGKGDVQI